MKTFSNEIIRYILRNPTDKDKDIISKILEGISIDLLDLGGYTERLAYGLDRVRKLFEEHEVAQFDFGLSKKSFIKQQNQLVLLFLKHIDLLWQVKEEKLWINSTPFILIVV